MIQPSVYKRCGARNTEHLAEILLAQLELLSHRLAECQAAQQAAEPVDGQHQAFVDSLPAGDDKMFEQIQLWAQQSYARHKGSVRGQQFTAADSADSHIIWATLRWAKENPAPTQQPLTELSPEFTDTARAALLWVLWHHQGGSSPVGQPIRFALGMGAHDRLTDQQIREAKRWASLDPKPAHGIIPKNSLQPT